MKKMAVLVGVTMVALAVIAGPALAADQAKASEPAPAAEKRGGAMGFVAGCLFGFRGAADYNDGKKIHWSEWVNALATHNIWSAIKGATGATRSDFRTQYGDSYY